MDDCAPIANGAEAHAMLPSFSRTRRWRRLSCALISAGKHWTNGGAAASCQKCDALRRDRRPSEHTPHACSPVFMPKQTVRSAAVGRAAITVGFQPEDATRMHARDAYVRGGLRPPLNTRRVRHAHIQHTRCCGAALYKYTATPYQPPRILGTRAYTAALADSPRARHLSEPCMHATKTPPRLNEFPVAWPAGDGQLVERALKPRRPVRPGWRRWRARRNVRIQGERASTRAEQTRSLFPARCSSGTRPRACGATLSRPPVQRPGELRGARCSGPWPCSALFVR